MRKCSHARACARYSYRALEMIQQAGDGATVRVIPNTLFQLMMKGVDKKVLKESME